MGELSNVKEDQGVLQVKDMLGFMMTTAPPSRPVFIHMSLWCVCL